MFFAVRRSKAVLVAPSRATPRVTKTLSDIDDHHELMYLQPAVEFFRRCSPVDGSTPPADAAKAVKEALAEALVYYYPLAGRLVDHPGGKLAVECTGEGVVFVEADADVSLEQLGDPPLPPFPCVEELLCDVGDTRAVLGAPLFFMQVTRFTCGGFVIGLHICHNIADGFGSTQFLKAVTDFGRGEGGKIILPVWKRELFKARIPPRINPACESIRDRLGDPADDVMLSTPPEEMVGQYFVFGPKEIAALRNHASANVAQTATSFELLTAVMWRCRTVALGYEDHQQVRLLFSMNARGRWNRSTVIPQGFYGNALFYPAVEARVSELCGEPLGHTLQLIRTAKNEMTNDNMDAMVDFFALLRSQPKLIIDRMYEVSDIKWVGQDELDFGWGKRVTGGVPMVGDITAKSVSYHMRYKNPRGENIIAVSMLLPKPAMEKFAKEISFWL